MATRSQAANPERIHAVLQQFRILMRSMKRHYERVERHAGIAGAPMWALAQIAASPGLSVGDLARGLAVHLSTASNLVKRLEAAGFVSRGRAANNQRVVRLGITADGRAALRRTPGPPSGVLQQALLDLPAARLKSLASELDVLLEHLEQRDARAGTQPLGELWAGAKPRSAAGRGQALARSTAPTRRVRQA